MEDVKKYMEEHSYFDLDDEQDNHLVYSSRENGDVSSEIPGQEDFAHVRSIINGIYSLGYFVDVEPVDEYVMITISK